MKKTRFALTVLASAILAFSSMSCHDDIYYLIQQEVPQQKGLQGDIKSIVPFKGNLYTANSYLYTKTMDSSSDTKKYNGQWTKVDAKCGKKKLVHIEQLAADDSNLYCYTIEHLQDKDNSLNIGYYKCLYSSSDGKTWTQVDVSSVTNQKDDDHGSYSVSSVVIFDNQVGNGSLAPSSGRNAYIKLAANQGEKEPSYGIYKLSGTSLGGKVDPGFDVGVYTTPKALNIGGTDKFFHSNGVAKNDKFAYIGVGSTIYCTDDGNIYDDESKIKDGVKSVKVDCGNISSMAITNDYLLLGTYNGLYRVALETDGVPAKTIDFENNAQTLVTSHVTCLYALDSTKNEGQTDEYAAIAVNGTLSSSTDSFKENGLYAFYPDRGNWNRDGDK